MTKINNIYFIILIILIITFLKTEIIQWFKLSPIGEGKCMAPNWFSDPTKWEVCLRTLFQRPLCIWWPFFHVQSNCHNLSSFEPVTSANIVSPYPKITVAHIHCLVHQSRHILFVSVRTVSHSQADCVPLLNFASDGERTLACQFSVSKNVGGRTGDDTIVFKY